MSYGRECPKYKTAKGITSWQNSLSWENCYFLSGEQWGVKIREGDETKAALRTVVWASDNGDNGDCDDYDDKCVTLDSC